MALPRDGTSLAQRLVVGVRVLDELAAAEEVQLGEFVRHLLLLESRLVRTRLSRMSITFSYGVVAVNDGALRDAETRDERPVG
jgi:hypothetical protein